MPSQDDYLDDLLKNMDSDSADANSAEEKESFAGDPVDDDTRIEKAVSELEEAFDSDDNLNLEELLGLKSMLETDPEADQDEGEISESMLPEEILSALGEKADAGFGEGKSSKLDAEPREVQSSEHKVDDSDELDELDLDEIYSDIGDFSVGNGEMEADSRVNSSQQGAAPDLDAVSSMSEDEIERLLSAGDEKDSVTPDKSILSDDEELLDMLGGLGDEDFQDIHEMLHRADNNEDVDESLLRRDLDKKDEFSGLPGGEDDLQNTLSEKEQKAQQKKLRKQEKAEAKAAAKAAKAAAKAEKAAAKAAAKAEKAAAKTGTTMVGGTSEGSPDENVTMKDDKKGSPSTLFDTSLLDSIVAGAGQAGGEKMTAVVPKDSGDVNSGEDSARQSENDSNEFDTNMDGLSGEDGNDDLSGQNDLKSSESTAPNIGKADAVIVEHEEPEPKKGGFLSKIMDFLTEDDEEDEESTSLQLSEENRDILNDLDNEEANDKKKKKGASAAGKDGKGKAKKSKPKKPKAPEKPKKPKPKKSKPEKTKKEKTPEPEPLIPEQKLTLKKVMPVMLVGVSLCVFIILLANVSVDFADKRAAEEAFNAGDYQTCFQNLYGKNLNEAEQLMFGKSESILYIRLWLREYEMFAQDGAEVEALDSLIQTVDDYPQLYNYAVQWDAGAEVAAGYQTVLSILLEKYGLTEEQAREIAAERSDRKYTRMIVEIVLGNGFDSLNEQPSTSGSEQQISTSESEQADLQDVLPEEEGLGEGEFIEN